MKQPRQHPSSLSELWTSLSVLLGGCAVAIYILIGVHAGTAAAVTIGTERTYDQEPSHLQSISTLEAAVDQYLNSIPSDFYAIGTVDSLKRLMANSDPFLIDVRNASEYQAGHIIGAINMPLRELGRYLEAIPTDQEVVLYCSTGYRSAMGVMALRLHGLSHVQGFPPGFAGWEAAGEPVSLPGAP